MTMMEDVQAIPAMDERTTKEAEVSEQWERIAKLEGRFEESDKHLATKADVERVRFDVLVEVAEVRTEVERVRTEVERVRSDVLERVAGVEGRVDSVQREIGHLKWFMGIGVVVGLGFGGWIVMLLNRLLAGGIP